MSVMSQHTAVVDHQCTGVLPSLSMTTLACCPQSRWHLSLEQARWRPLSPIPAKCIRGRCHLAAWMKPCSASMATQPTDRCRYMSLSPTRLNRSLPFRNRTCLRNRCLFLNHLQLTSKVVGICRSIWRISQDQHRQAHLHRSRHP